jgi:hypothetical protein
MTTLDERRGFSSEIRRRINHTQQLDLPLHALAGLRRILRDALDATCGPEGT